VRTSREGKSSTVQILLAEDDPTLAAMTTELLTDEGYDVTWVSTMEQVRQVRDSAPWDLFLVDTLSRSYAQPAPEDLVFLQELMALAPAILLTGRSWALHTKAADLGVTAVVVKPYDLEQLLAAIRAVVSDRPGMLDVTCV
jgi:two-component system, cell cycle response regulator CpdR